jgi:hypothetical protein
MRYFSFSTHKECSLSRLHCSDFLKNLVGFEPGSSVPETDAMSNAPRRQGEIFELVWSNEIRIMLSDKVVVQIR